jgi:hypothetical protein
MSYRDKVDVGIITDRDQVDDAWPFMQAIDDGLRELDQVVCGRTGTTGRAMPDKIAT